MVLRSNADGITTQENVGESGPLAVDEIPRTQTALGAGRKHYRDPTPKMKSLTWILRCVWLREGVSGCMSISIW
jgi:hypothetical protein